jgi:hypothetical protein
MPVHRSTASAGVSELNGFLAHTRGFKSAWRLHCKTDAARLSLCSSKLCNSPSREEFVMDWRWRWYLCCCWVGDRCHFPMRLLVDGPQPLLPFTYGGEKCQRLRKFGHENPGCALLRSSTSLPQMLVQQVRSGYILCHLSPCPDG